MSNPELVELQRWHDKDVSISLYYNSEYQHAEACKKFHIVDYRDSKHNTDFNDLQFAIKYVEALIRYKKRGV